MKNQQDIIKKAAIIFAELTNEQDKYTRDPYNDGYIAHAVLDDRSDKSILRLTYVFEAVPRVRQYWKAFLDDGVNSLVKDTDSEFDNVKSDPKVYDLDDFIPQIVELAFPDPEQDDDANPSGVLF